MGVTRGVNRGARSLGRAVFPRGWLVLTTHAAAFLMAVCLVEAPALAQQVVPPATEDRMDFDIPSQDLNSALLSFADTAGIQLFYDAARVQDLRSTAVRGGLTPRDALTRLLAGTGITFTFSDADTVVLKRNAVQDSGPMRLGPVMVQGELQRRSLQDTPTSVAVIRGEDLERRGDVDIHDAVERTPNVTSAFGEDGFSIRGIDQRGAAPGGSGLVVNTTVDGATLVTNQSTFFGPYSTWDLDQVEVLRGPQSTQQGRNALAGAIVIRSKDPTYAYEAKARGDLAQHDTRGGALTLNAPLIEDALAVRLSVDHLRTDGFVENPTLDDDEYDAREQTTLRGKVRVDPTQDLSAILSFTYASNFGGDDFIDQDRFPEDRVNLSDVEDAKEGAKHRIAGLRLNYDVSDSFSIESETTYLDSDYERFQDLFRTPAAGLLIDFEVRTESFEQELRLRYEQERLNAVVGGFYADIAQRSIDPGFAIDTKVDTRNVAAFGEAEFQILPQLPQLWLVAGGRYDTETAETKASGLEREATFGALLPKAGVTYDWTDDVSTSVTVQRGYRAGGTQVNRVTGAVNEFDPSFTWNYELALRSRWFDGRLTANANAFYTDWTDQQARILGPSGSLSDFDVQNAGKSRLFGGELDLRLAPVDNLELFGSVGYVKTEFLEFDNRGEDLSGNEFPFAPNLTAAFGASYYFDNGFEIHADASFTEGSFGDVSNTDGFRSDSRFLLNALAGYETDHWGAFVYARNILDKDYLTLAFPTNSIAGEPFTIGGFVTVNF